MEPVTPQGWTEHSLLSIKALWKWVNGEEWTSLVSNGSMFPPHFQGEGKCLILILWSGEVQKPYGIVSLPYCGFRAWRCINNSGFLLVWMQSSIFLLFFFFFIFSPLEYGVVQRKIN